MAHGLILESSYVIDLEREIAGSTAGPASRFLEQRAEEPLFLTVTVVGELAAGASLSSRADWEDFIAPFEILPIDRDAAWEYGKAYRYLKANGMLIASNDLWIAATALAREMPVVTRDPGHFGRVPGLEVVTYLG